MFLLVGCSENEKLREEIKKESDAYYIFASKYYIHNEEYLEKATELNKILYITKSGERSLTEDENKKVIELSTELVPLNEETRKYVMKIQIPEGSKEFEKKMEQLHVAMIDVSMTNKFMIYDLIEYYDNPTYENADKAIKSTDKYFESMQREQNKRESIKEYFDNKMKQLEIN